MTRFLAWFRATGPGGKTPMPPLARSGMAHLYFESIHPFEDGNGRIGRAISLLALFQALERPTLIALSQTIHAGRKTYYAMLEKSNKSCDITAWLVYFAETTLEAQKTAQRAVDFIVTKTRFLDAFRGKLNARQEKAVLRMLRAGPEGSEGGMSAEKYVVTTGASRATATRDLRELVVKNALTRSGLRKGTRYALRLAPFTPA